MIDWSLDPTNRALYEKVVAQNRKLQKELGIQPMTIEQRHQLYLKRKQEEENFKKLMGQRRPPPKWKV